MDLTTALVAAATLGLASTAHCAAMCGPLAAVACRTQRAKGDMDGTSEGRRAGGPAVRPWSFDGYSAAGYFGGRIVGYALLGGAVGAAGAGLVQLSSSPWLRIVVGVLVASVIAARAISWCFPRMPSLLRLRRNRSAPVESGLLERLYALVPRSRMIRGPALGLLTALFPCGASLAAVLAASQGGSAGVGAAMMAIFALASAPGLVAALLLGARVLGLRLVPGTGVARVAGLSMLLVAGWMAVSPVIAWARTGASGGAPACHCHH